MAILFIELVLTFLVIFIGTQLLINSSISLSNKLKIPKIIVGAIIVSSATSLPEFFVTYQAALRGLNDFAIGNVIGSNISNLGLVLGLMAILTPLTVNKAELNLNYIPLVFFTLMFSFGVYFLFFFNLLYGILSLLLLFSFSFLIIKKGDRLIDDEEYNFSESIQIIGINIKIKYTIFFILLLLIGSFILWWGTSHLIKNSKEIATILGVSDRVISISLVALGTSLPELFSSIYSILKSEQKMAIGNILGSNIFNLLAVLGVTSIFTNLEINKFMIKDTLFMLALTLLLIPIFYIRKKRNSNILNISSFGGVILFLSYTIYLFYLFKNM